MRGKKLSIGSKVAITIVSLTLVAAGIASGQERVLYNFDQPGHGALPGSTLVWDAAGNLYGTTVCSNGNGSCSGGGIVFELMPNVRGDWTSKVLHTFVRTDGRTPEAGLIWDAAGNLYGVTGGGGAYGRGTVFELTPTGDGRWTEKVLHSFSRHPDGDLPLGNLIWDAAGNLYGTTVYGGNQEDAGTVFQLTPNTDGSWTEKVLHMFGHGTDGFWPQAGLLLDAAGNLYGTTLAGGANSRCSDGCGTVFELTPNGSGSWTEKKLHNFGINGTDGQRPYGSLIWDAAGNLYGTTANGGAYGEGTVFEMMPNMGGGWTEKKLHSFGIDGRDGQNPSSSLTWDAAGHLYGTTTHGGAFGHGTVFEMTPNEGGGWTEKRLHHFDYGGGRDGGLPGGNLIWDTAGNLYGTTSTGDGADGPGTVFEITP